MAIVANIIIDISSFPPGSRILVLCVGGIISGIVIIWGRRPVSFRRRRRRSCEQRLLGIPLVASVVSNPIGYRGVILS